MAIFGMFLLFWPNFGVQITIVSLIEKKGQLDKKLDKNFGMIIYLLDYRGPNYLLITIITSN